MIYIILFLLFIKILLRQRAHYYHQITIDIEDRLGRMCDSWYKFSEEGRRVELQRLRRHVDGHISKLPPYDKNLTWNDTCCYYVLYSIKDLLKDRQLVYQADLSSLYQTIIDNINMHYPPYAEKIVQKYVSFSIEDMKTTSTTAE